MDFTTLIAQLKAGDTDKALETAEALKPIFDKTIADLQGYEGKLSDAVSTRDKAKEKIKALAGVLGINDDEITPDKVRELMKTGKGDEAHKAEVANLTKLIADKDADYAGKLAEKDNQFRDKLIEIEISKIGLNADVVNDKALNLVIASLKEGATLEDGKIVYKDASGTRKIDSMGQPLTVAQQMEAFKADASNAFLFKPTSTGGGGSQPSGATGSKKFSEMTGAELVALYRTNPAEYERLKNENK